MSGCGGMAGNYLSSVKPLYKRAGKYSHRNAERGARCAEVLMREMAATE